MTNSRKAMFVVAFIFGWLVVLAVLFIVSPMLGVIFSIITSLLCLFVILFTFFKGLFDIKDYLEK